MHKYSDYNFYHGSCDEFTAVKKIAVFCNTGNGMAGSGGANLFTEPGRAVNLFSLLDAMSSSAGRVRYLVHICSYNSTVSPIEDGFLPTAYARTVLETKSWLMRSGNVPDLGCVFRYLDRFEAVGDLDAVIILSKNFSAVNPHKAALEDYKFSRFAIGINAFDDLTDTSQRVLECFLGSAENYHEADGLAVRTVIKKIEEQK